MSARRTLLRGARGRSGVSHVTLRSMDTETRFGRTHRRYRKWLMALRLSCRRRNVGAAPGPADMTGATPLFPCLLRHGEDRHGTCPCHPPSGSLRLIGPLQEGFQTGRGTRVPSLMARLWTRPPCPRPRTTMGTRTSSRRARDPPPRSGAWRPSRKGLLAGSDPRGRGQECANTPGPEAAAGPRTAGSLPAPPECPDRHWPVGAQRRKTLPRLRIAGGIGVNPRRAGP